MTRSAKHIPVMQEEVLDKLDVQSGQWYIDATFGQGGHSQGILARGGNVVGLDFDEDAITLAEQNFAQEMTVHRLILVRENFAKLSQVAQDVKNRQHIDHFSGVLFDFGTNSDQLTNQDRGFSFTSSAELDMRLDQRLGVKARDLLAVLSAKQLTQLFEEYGGERFAKRIAQAIVKRRDQGQPITRANELVEIITRIKYQRGKLHPATQVFQALRIAVNDELTNIRQALPAALEVVNRGVIITISFHEGEDRIAKQFMKSVVEEERGSLEPLLTPSASEIQQNPRARSAKMRVLHI